MRTNKEQMLIKQVRLANIKSNGKHMDCPGVVRKLTREIRNLAAAEDK